MEARGPTRVRAFDGLRGLAVAAVVLFHSQLSHARGGFLGVSAFFTLSGYLITSLLLDEHDRTGGISLSSFWARRARRLLPAAYVALAGVVLYGATVASADQVRALRGDVLAALGYVANWRFYYAGRSYEHLFSAPSPVLHFWSLAIEEQFYVLFPLLMFGLLRLTRGRRSVIGSALLAGAAGSVVTGIVLLNTSGQSRVYYGTDTRAAELLIGAVLAVVLSGREPRVRPASAQRAGATLVGVAALGTMVWWWATVDQSSRWLYQGGFAAHALLTAIVITAARVDGPLAGTLAWRPLETLGRLSYGIYLFHWPIFLWLSPDRTGLSTLPLFLLRVPITLVVATLSFRLLEQPVLRGERLRGAWPRLVAPATVVALVAALLTVTWSPPPAPIVLSSLGNKGPATPLVPPPEPRPGLSGLYRPLREKRPLRVLVVGDSVGLTFGRGVEQWAREQGDATVVNHGQIFCPLGRDIPIQVFTETINPSACDWTKPWNDLLQSFDPDVTIVMYSVWERFGRKLAGESSFKYPGDPALDAWQLSEYQAAATTLTARGGHVVWMNLPCERDTPVDKGHGSWYVNRRTIPALARSRANVHVVDLDDELCPGDKFRTDYRGVADARPDGSHFSDAGALAVAGWLMPIVLGQAPLPDYRREE